jgi:hypothetical protein
MEKKEAEKENHEPSIEQSIGYCEPCTTRPRLSFSLSARKQSRFVPAVSDEEVVTASKGVVPKNTKRNNTWAINNFTEWKRHRNLQNPDDPVPEDLLECHDPATVNKWLCRYVLETRQENGSNYPPKSIYSLLCGIQRVTRENNVPFSFLDKNDLRFKDLHRTLDSICSDLHSRGIGADVRSALVISYEHEDMFWQSGALGYCSPRILFYTMFFYAGLSFCLRGGQEQRDLIGRTSSVFLMIRVSMMIIHTMSMSNLFLRTINIDSMRYI